MTDQPLRLPHQAAYERILRRRHMRGTFWQRFFSLANIIALLALVALALNIVNQAFGLVAVEYAVQPGTIAGRPLDELDNGELSLVLAEHVPNRLRVILRDNLSVVTGTAFTQLPVSELFPGRDYPPELAESLVADLTQAQQAALLADNLEHGRLVDLVVEEISKPRIVSSWSLFDSLFARDGIEATAADKYPDAILQFRAWASVDFATSSISSSATTAGLRTALLGSMWIIFITITVAFPLGVGAAIYLEEYASKGHWLERLIEINIRNLAGVPSIIYGMLGLAVFVRVFGYFTSGEAFGVTDSNGRTVLSAGLTMALLILPVIIINAQEALRAVPPSLREGSYGLGATKWQTIWRQVLPVAFPGILTGVILSVSRAVGETAPLIVVGASTFIGIDPNGPFSKFTVVPIQIYQWTSRPEAEFKNLAAAAIIILLILLLTLNATAIFLRQYYRRKLQL